MSNKMITVKMPLDDVHEVRGMLLLERCMAERDYEMSRISTTAQPSVQLAMFCTPRLRSSHGLSASSTRHSDYQATER